MKITLPTEPVKDLVTGLTFTFRQPNAGGAWTLNIERHDEGIPGIMNRDLVFSLDGEHVGSGSGCGQCNGLPINPPESELDPADAWKRA